jgi:hypothetical protein
MNFEIGCVDISPRSQPDRALSALRYGLKLNSNNDVHLIWSRKVHLVIVNHEVINIMSPIGSLFIVYKYFVTWI